MEPVKIDVEKLSKYCHFKNATGLVMGVITDEQISETIKKGKFESRENDLVVISALLKPDESIFYNHCERVAYLVVNGWDEPIRVEIDFGHKYWPIVDGNHRFRAAIYKKDKWILANYRGPQRFIYEE